MELKVVYKQQHRKAIEEKVKYIQNHFHDYSIITTNRNLDDSYAVKMTIEVFMQALQKKDENNPPHAHRFFMFLVQHYPHRVQYIFEKAGPTVDQYQQVTSSTTRRQEGRTSLYGSEQEDTTSTDASRNTARH
eukprot:2775358-Amphidinium_carterae.1